MEETFERRIFCRWEKARKNRISGKQNNNQNMKKNKTIIKTCKQIIIDDTAAFSVPHISSSILKAIYCYKPVG